MDLCTAKHKVMFRSITMKRHVIESLIRKAKALEAKALEQKNGNALETSTETSSSLDTLD